MSTFLLWKRIVGGDGVNRRAERSSLWLLFVGLLMIGLGIYVWLHPAEAIFALGLYLGIAFLMSGTAFLISFFSGTSSWNLAQGILEIILGILFVLDIGVTLVSIPIILAFWGLFIGVLGLTAAYHFFVMGAPQWIWTALSGLLGILFCFLVILNPFAGLLTATMLIGIYLLLYGILSLVEYFSGR